MPDEVFDFDLLLAHSAGSIGRGEPRLYARLRAVFVRGHPLSGSSLSVLAHERDTGAWREWTMQASGFDGPDAPALKSAFRSLFALAGCGAFDPAVFGATGEQDGPRSA